MLENQDAMNNITLHYIPLHRLVPENQDAMNNITLHYITLHYITLHRLVLRTRTQ